jgi:hypothetical protein
VLTASSSSNGSIRPKSPQINPNKPEAYLSVEVALPSLGLRWLAYVATEIKEVHLMAYAGQILENAISGERIAFRKTASACFIGNRE